MNRISIVTVYTLFIDMQINISSYGTYVYPLVTRNVLIANSTRDAESQSFIPF